jgi:hypothetical protein
MGGGEWVSKNRHFDVFHNNLHEKKNVRLFALQNTYIYNIAHFGKNIKRFCIFVANIFCFFVLFLRGIKQAGQPLGEIDN